MASVLRSASQQRMGQVQTDGGFAVKKRDIMRSANVNHTQLTSYLERLESKGFIVQYDGSDRLHLEITAKGEQLLQRADALSELLN